MDPLTRCRAEAEHGQQGGGELEGFPSIGLSPLFFVLSLLASPFLEQREALGEAWLDFHPWPT
jgi:hypothetical protein